MEVTQSYEYDWLQIFAWADRLKLKLGPECREQIMLFCWIRSRSDLEPFVFFVPNDRKTNRINGQILKYAGLKTGVSDIFIGIPRGKYHGMFVELKAGKGKPTEHQKKFLSDMTMQGYMAIWATGYEAARAFIEEYLCFV